MPKLNDGLASLPAIIEAIPANRYRNVQKHVEHVEVALRYSAALLKSVRRYFLEKGDLGERSPIVQEIDKLLSRD